MADLILRTSDKRVMSWGQSVEQKDDRYVVTKADGVTDETFNSYSFPTALKQGAATPPDDLVGGWNYNYVGTAYVDSGVAPPEPEPAPDPEA